MNILEHLYYFFNSYPFLYQEKKITKINQQNSIRKTTLRMFLINQNICFLCALSKLIELYIYILF